MATISKAVSEEVKNQCKNSRKENFRLEFCRVEIIWTLIYEPELPFKF